MKKRFNIALTVLLLTLSLTLLAGCQEESPDETQQPQSESAETEAKIPPTVEELTAKMDALLSTSSKMSAMDEEYLLYMMELDPAGITDWVVKVQTSGTEVDQYGIFLAPTPQDAEVFSKAIRAYLDRTEESWAQFNYLPEELPKLEKSTVEVNGQYVLYIVAAESEKAACIEAFHQAVN